MDEDEKLAHILYQLNNALDCRSPGEIQKWTDEFNLRMRLREMFGPKQKSHSSSGSDFWDFVAGVVREKGIRPYELEKAVHSEKIVISGHVDLKQNVLEALRGEQPLKISFSKPGITIKIAF